MSDNKEKLFLPWYDRKVYMTHDNYNKLIRDNSTIQQLLKDGSLYVVDDPDDLTNIVQVAAMYSPLHKLIAKIISMDYLGIYIEIPDDDRYPCSKLITPYIDDDNYTIYASFSCLGWAGPTTRDNVPVPVLERILQFHIIIKEKEKPELVKPVLVQNNGLIKLEWDPQFTKIPNFFEKFMADEGGKELIDLVKTNSLFIDDSFPLRKTDDNKIDEIIDPVFAICKVEMLGSSGLHVRYVPETYPYWHTLDNLLNSAVTVFVRPVGDIEYDPRDGITVIDFKRIFKLALMPKWV